MTVKEIRIRLHTLGDCQKAQFLQRFFKTGPGEYGEGDMFLGIRVPDLRKLASACKTIPDQDVLPLLLPSIHEERLLGTSGWMLRYAIERFSPAERRMYLGGAYERTK